jgi:hypothetical protein
VTHALPVQSSTFRNCSADASGLSTALEDATGEGCQELSPPVCQMRSGCPDLDVNRGRFEPLSYVLGPLGLQEPFRRLQSCLRRLGGAMDVWGGIDRGTEDCSAACSGVCRTLARARRS